MAKKMDLEKKSVITPEFRVSYPSVFQMTEYEDSKPEYAVTALFPKTLDMKSIRKAMVSAAKEKWGADKEQWPKGIRWPIRDGDKEKPDSPEYEGMYFIKFSSKKSRPGLVGPNAKPIVREEDFYAGCYARAQVVAYAYERKGNKGVAFDLWNIQKLRDGEAFSGRKKAEDVFEAIEDEEDDDGQDLEEDDEDEQPRKVPSAGKKKSKKDDDDDMDWEDEYKRGRAIKGRKKPEPEDDDDEDLDADEDDDEDEKPRKKSKPSKKKKAVNDDDWDDDFE